MPFTASTPLERKVHALLPQQLRNLLVELPLRHFAGHTVPTEDTQGVMLVLRLVRQEGVIRFNDLVEGKALNAQGEVIFTSLCMVLLIAPFDS